MNQNLELAQKQWLSQHLVQSMQILQMSAVELETYLEKLQQENPAMELDQEPSISESMQELLRQRKMEWLSSSDYQNRIYYDRDTDDFTPESSDQETTLADYLFSQMILMDFTPEERRIMEFLVYSLNPKGFLEETPEELSELIPAAPENVSRMIKELQTLDPAGVGAHSIEECLLLQLHRRDSYSETTEKIILGYLKEIGRNHLKETAKALQVPLADVKQAIEEIRSLNPNPGNAFSDRRNNSYISPDAVIVRTAKGFEILINKYQYPSFTVSPYYRNLMEETEDAEVKKYLREKISQVESVTRDIRQRTSALSAVLHEIIERQKPFFVYGPGNRRPMGLAELSSATGFHESTVSRTLRGKYLQCSFGVYPLSYFLTKNIGKEDSDTGSMTPEYVQMKIRDIISQEDARHPLNDEEIRKLLLADGIELSRRTVNKYRSLQGIPDRKGRKQI